ncbi:MAG: hypothetical protein C4523_12925 [Myxococcales bacterium]|nr:MAG: hypothetical protein C4523_12925 [Myxococcales bacterium]
MCAQMAEVARQRTLAARELLCANVLDAALRTLSCKPYKSNDKSSKVDACMELFRNKFLPRVNWDGRCKEVVKSYHRLRHRNAHPDWLTNEGGGLSDDAREQSLDDMIRLAWFCGYMILAMAGLENLEPKFPGPHEDWGPLITVTGVSPQ